ncbi:Terephthalate 1,2-dioxygenase, terminal oxygenase component subunit alpha 1 [Bradyrhizobium ivorense]|uniref:Terephthalate 1,2-dioxygenase, terminal oxygenase component subunit alpha 1 n=1 Tax=Bradyrhizobium ivorense TaxID=2511166 RepID=A0A508T0P3_9BRAD|nr:aromatic ring-hydroxylating dioxygenase subunit alpha [Bradyrhizobium ivorense]VIO68882.1 Terephthalate 1,2-dioxygenase, terminal oxygenase component subunit alpha 1 [Bradyrhizobium ivorense]
MLDQVSGTPRESDRVWSNDGVTRVPFWIFQDKAIYAAEQQRIFQGPSWNFLCLAIEVKNTGDFVTTFVGDTPVIVSRDSDGELYAFENRCAHRGALIALESRGNTKAFTCVYHAWSYDRQGNLKEVAFKEGIKGKGGMPPSFCMEQHNPRKLRLAEAFGVVFGSFSNDVPPLEEHLGEEIYSRIGRVMSGRTPVVLGRYTQALPNNWKLYMENVKDSYHASILHLFFTTFELNRLSQTGGIIVDPSGGHHVSFSAIDPNAAKSSDYDAQDLRSDSEFKLADPSLLQSFKEFPDNTTLQILSVFPTFVLQQIQNAIAVRQIVPRGPDKTDLHWTLLGFAEDTPEQRMTRLKQANLVGPAGYISMEDGCVGGFVQRGILGAPDEQAIIEMGGSGTDSSESRVTEASVRGFWKAYRARMGV